MRNSRVVILVALLALATFILWTAVAVATNITVDGDGSDWASADFILDDGDEGLIPDEYDIRSVYATLNDGQLQHFIAFTTAASTQINTQSAINVWYDLDANAATGYPLGPIGVERHLAWRMDTDACEVNEWTGSSFDLVSNDCDGAPSGLGTNKGSFVEVGADTAALGLGGTSKLDICMLFENADFGGYPDDTVCFTHEWDNGGGEGCTPGYWKQPHHFDSWVPPYSPIDPQTYFDDPDVFGVGPHKTLLQVLKTGGGGEAALGRHAVAALLNAASGGVSYEYYVQGIKDMVKEAYDTGDFERIKNLFAQQNELGCPLN
jgi:hypothetical protein